jgi:DNA modification methylase
VSQSFHNGKVVLHAGDCMEVLRELPDNSIDAVCTDPPYHLTSIVKRFGSPNAQPAKGNAAFTRASRGFMGKQWDGGDIAFTLELWAEVLRVLKPGGHMVAFSGTRTYHRMACAIEDAGFEIRDQLAWTYGSGFPKSHDVSKGIDRAAGAERTERLAPKPGHENFVGRDNMRSLRESGVHSGDGGFSRPWMHDPQKVENAHWQFEPATDAARQWRGWGTALKPAWEPICLARKPLSEGTVAANVLRWGTGAINVDGCRIATDETITATRNYLAGAIEPGGMEKPGDRVFTRYEQNKNGRFPANLIHDGSPEVLAGFPESKAGIETTPRGNGGIWSGVSNTPCGPQYGDVGSAARFFYTAKADADDRLGSKHPTVKPVDLMQWLVRLICPKGGTVLDPFAGTGTTGAAAFIEGCRAVLIEREDEYLADIERRMELLLSGPDERSRKLTKPDSHESLPLFGAA